MWCVINLHTYESCWWLAPDEDGDINFICMRLLRFDLFIVLVKKCMVIHSWHYDFYQYYVNAQTQKRCHRAKTQQLWDQYRSKFLYLELRSHSNRTHVGTAGVIEAGHVPPSHQSKIAHRALSCSVVISSTSAAGSWLNSNASTYSSGIINDLNSLCVYVVSIVVQNFELHLNPVGAHHNDAWRSCFYKELHLNHVGARHNDVWRSCFYKGLHLNPVGAHHNDVWRSCFTNINNVCKYQKYVHSSLASLESWYNTTITALTTTRVSKPTNI